MFKTVIILALRNMSAAKKTKQTLAKKLSSKVPQKREAELKPELFTEIKNSQKAKDTTVKQNVKEDGLQKQLKKPIEKVSVQKQDLNAVEQKKPRRTPRTIKVKEEGSDAALEIVSKRQKIEKSSTILVLDDIKHERSSLKSETKKPSDIEVPSCSKEIKEEHKEQKWEPLNWQLLLDNIRIMRSKDNAPVDTMGCHKCADENADAKTQRYHKLVALMLSSQTKDETTYHAMLRLREHSLTPKTISEMKVNVLENILHPVSFYKNKAKYLQQTSKILIENYNSDIPNNIKELVALPGVGPKMAHICMATAWHETTGIGVDVHVHRICNRLQWLPKTTKEPEQTRVALESWLPRNLWKEVNHLLVGFGQTTCTPVKPKCLDCLNCDICPAAPKAAKTQDKLENIKLMKICDKSKFKKTKMHL